jgi:hypothetical protein
MLASTARPLGTPDEHDRLQDEVVADQQWIGRDREEARATSPPEQHRAL